jgi:hypothetical protein
MKEKLTVILPCAGEGSRLSLPYPKELYCIEKGKSLVDYSFDLFSNFHRGEVNFVLTINENKTDIVKYLSKYKSKYEISFTYFDPNESEYTGSLKSCRHLFGENNLVLLPDTILRLKENMNLHETVIENLDETGFSFFYKMEDSAQMLKTKGALYVNEENLVLKYEDKPNDGFSRFNSFWCAFAFKRNVFDQSIKFMEQSTLKTFSKNIGIKDTSIYLSKGIEVEDYIDLGTWDQIYSRIKSNIYDTTLRS